MTLAPRTISGLVLAAALAATATVVTAAPARAAVAERPLGVLFGTVDEPPTVIPAPAAAAAPPPAASPAPVSTPPRRPPAPTFLFNAAPEDQRTATGRRPAAATPSPAPVARPVAPQPPAPTFLFNAAPEDQRTATDRRPAAATPSPAPVARRAAPQPPTPTFLFNPAPGDQPVRRPDAEAAPAAPTPPPPAASTVRTAPAAPTAGGETAPSGDQEALPPVNLSADEMSFDQEKGVVTASGNVEVGFKGRVLRADRITYDQNTNIVSAKGNVTILEPTGETLFADQMTVTGDLKDGLVRNIGIILADKARLAARGAKRTGAVVTELRKGVYSPCNLCPDNPDKPPLWQIKAVRVIHDKRTKTIEYRDAWLEVAGFPVFYTPYFVHPDPTVRRKSGFLAPGFGGSSDLGFVARAPYFLALSETSDATLIPTYSEEEGFLLAGEYRKKFKNGELDTKASLTQDSKDDIRGHIATKGRFDIDRTWRAGFDINRSTDDTYLRRFGFDSPAVLESRLFAEGFRGRNYAAANAYSFQDLRSGAGAFDSPTVLPFLEFNHVGEPDRFGGNFTLDASFLDLIRKDNGADTRRLSIRPAWHRRFHDSLGSLITFSTGLFADGYHVTGVERSGDDPFSGVTGRVHPYASVDWRFPLVGDLRGLSQVIEPIVNVAVSPNGGNPSSIPNEDSQEFEFDDTNLFEINRFGGTDRVEGGPRINYGLKWGLFGQRGGKATVLVGQTFRLHEDDTFAEGSGLENSLSDIVAAVRLEPNEHLNLSYRTQIDHREVSARRHEINLNTGVPFLRVHTSYFFFEDPVGSEFSGREELSMAASSQLNKNWRLSVQGVRDIAANEMRSLSADLVYENECVAVNTRFARTFFEDRDLQPTDSFTINLILKTLGEVTF